MDLKLAYVERIIVVILLQEHRYVITRNEFKIKYMTV